MGGEEVQGNGRKATLSKRPLYLHLQHTDKDRSSQLVGQLTPTYSTEEAVP